MTTELDKSVSEDNETVENYEFEPIQGYPMLNWKGKRPFKSTQYYPAQLKETYGKEVDGWRNKIYWGDNLQVMSHLLKNYRGKINLIYIDPPFDSKAEYKKKIQMKDKKVFNDHSAFEEKQYTDIWTNDEYLQFMFERLILMRELLSGNGSIYVHCDWHKSHYLRCMLDEIFGVDNFNNEIIWWYKDPSGGTKRSFRRKHDTVLFYVKTSDYIFNVDAVRMPYSEGTLKQAKEGTISFGQVVKVNPLGKLPDDVFEISIINSQAKERVVYPTQKPEALLEKIIKASSNPGDIIFDCFMGSGTTQTAAMKLGRRFVGADINLGAVETTTKRLLKAAEDIENNATQRSIIENKEDIQAYYTGFEVYNVNQYDIFRSPVEAKELLIEALEIQPMPVGSIYDGEKDGRMVKIMPINRIATRADLNELVTGFDYQAFQRRQEEQPTRPVEKLLLVCMGHEPDIDLHLENEVNYKLNIEVVDVLRDKSKLEFKRESKAQIVRSNGKLTIEQFYPMNLLQKLSVLEENVDDWRELVESVKIDFNYNGEVLNPSIVDSPEDELVEGTYAIPDNAGTIRVKITDLLSESLEDTVE